MPIAAVVAFVVQLVFGDRLVADVAEIPLAHLAAHEVVRAVLLVYLPAFGVRADRANFEVYPFDVGIGKLLDDLFCYLWRQDSAGVGVMIRVLLEMLLPLSLRATSPTHPHVTLDALDMRAA